VDFEERIPRLEKVVPELMEKGAVTGLSLCLVQEGQVVWSLASGVRDVESGQPVEGDTVFQAASLSKPVFTYGLLGLIEEGLLELDRPLGEYWDYEDLAHDERGGTITTRMVLSHSSGLPNWRESGKPLEFAFEPGEKFGYSGEGFVYLQKVVEQLTGMGLAEFAERRVFAPLGMALSGYAWREEYEERVAHGHNMAGESLGRAEWEDANAAASLHTTAAEFGRFVEAVLNGEGLAAESVREMLSPQVEVTEEIAWGLGWGLQEGEAGRSFWHWGDNGNFKAFTLGLPESGAGMAMFANSFYGQSIVGDLLRVLFDARFPAVAWMGYEGHDDPRRRVRDDLASLLGDSFSEMAGARVDVGVRWVDNSTYADVVRAAAGYPTCTYAFAMEPDHGWALLGVTASAVLALLGEEEIEGRPLTVEEVEMFHPISRRIVESLAAAWKGQGVEIGAVEMESDGPSFSWSMGEEPEYTGFMAPDGLVEIVGLQVISPKWDANLVNPQVDGRSVPALIFCYPTDVLESIFNREKEKDS
jgi:CubicO group peptidase (beta-lactamase class C family)